MIIEPMRKQSESESGGLWPALSAPSRPFDSLVCRCGHGIDVLVLFCTYYHAALSGTITILMADAPLTCDSSVLTNDVPRLEFLPYGDYLIGSLRDPERSLGQVL